jgi:aspartokinase
MVTKTTDDLVRIASFGGGVIIDSTRTTEDLVRIASYAANKGNRVVIKGADQKTTDDLVKIASFGRGTVVFDFTE